MPKKEKLKLNSRLNRKKIGDILIQPTKIYTKEILSLVRKAGIKWLALGIESGDKSVRLEVSKGKFEDVDVKKVINKVHEADINVMANYIYGLPGDTAETIEKTFNPKLIDKMSDEEAISYLSQLRQIGRWSAEMVLIFFYNRPNIWPVQDIGLLRAISNNYKKKYLPPKTFVSKLQKKFSPYCTLAVMALWYSVDNEPVQY